MLADIWTVDADPLELDLLVLDGVSLMCLSACVEPLRAANRIIGHTAYTWRLLSPGGQAVTTSSGITLKVDGRFTPGDVRNALWIVAAFGVPEQASPALLAKVGLVARRGVPLWGVESGGWVMALAGLLNGHRATVHWEDLEAFQARFPAVDVRSDRVVIDGPYVTAGGASPMLDLTLELIRNRQGLAVSIEVASIFIYDQSKASGDPQPRLTLGRVEQRDARVSRCLKLMGDHVERPLEIATLARRVGISSRMLERLFLRDLGQTPSLFYRDLRLNGARRLVIDTRKSLTEIAILTGFSSSSSFSRSFKERFGQSPKAARLAGSMDHYRNLTACLSCALKPRCTPTETRRVKRWVHEGVLDAMQERLDRMPDAMKIRRQTVEHPFGTLKAWMGATHFLTRTLAKVRTETSLQVLAYNMKRMIQIFGVGPLMQAIRA